MTRTKPSGGHCEQSAWHTFCSLLEGSGKEKISATSNSIVLARYFLKIVIIGSNLDVCAPRCPPEGVAFVMTYITFLCVESYDIEAHFHSTFQSGRRVLVSAYKARVLHPSHSVQSRNFRCAQNLSLIHI